MRGNEFRLELDTDVTTAPGDCAWAFVICFVVACATTPLHPVWQIQLGSSSS
jgi:hypothetical protein